MIESRLFTASLTIQIKQLTQYTVDSTKFVVIAWDDVELLAKMVWTEMSERW